METPSSTRRVTRSQTKKIQEVERICNSSRQKSALVDITNDSPIIGLAKAKVLKTPSSGRMSKKSVKCKVQGSGESILRGQVKTLLQKVEENTQIKILATDSVQSPNLFVFDNHVKELASVTPSLFDNKVSNIRMEEKKDFVTRSLIFDFMEKFDGYDSCEEVKGGSMGDGELVDELCEGMSKMNIEKEVVGKHTRFVYDSDGEVVEVEEEERIVASSALQLKGLPKPEGKHIRFCDQD